MTGEITRFSGPDGGYDQNKYNGGTGTMLGGGRTVSSTELTCLVKCIKETIGADGGIS